MTGPEDDWLRTVARQNYETDKARKIQPGRGHRSRLPRHDWVVLLVILGFILWGFVA